MRFERSICVSVDQCVCADFNMGSPYTIIIVERSITYVLKKETYYRNINLS